MNEARIKACVSRFDSGAYDTLQFLRAVSHAVGAHTDALQPSQHAESSDDGIIPLVPGSTGPGVGESRGVYLAPFLTYNLLINFRRSRGHVTTPT